MQNVKVHILIGTGRLNDSLVEIDHVVKQALKSINKKLPLQNIDYIIQDNPESTIPEIGVGGNAFFDHIVNIDLDPSFPDFPNSIACELTHTLAHESHHALRKLNGPGHGETLFDAMIAEGLADHFARDVIGPRAKVWSEEFYKKIPNVKKLAEKELDNKNFDYQLWFIGGDTKQVPRCTGYALGFTVVERYLKDNPKETPASLVNASSKKFRKYW